VKAASARLGFRRPGPPSRVGEVLTMCPDNCHLCTRFVPNGRLTIAFRRRRAPALWVITGPDVLAPAAPDARR
jgi:hypothetical protein